MKTERYFIEISCSSNEEKMALGTSIHEQLVGNPNYIDNRIGINVDEYKKVVIWVDDGCTELPIIKLDLNKKKA